MPSDVGIPCKGCGANLDCVDVNPLDIYSLEGPQFRFVLQCPVGENCTLSPVINFVCCGQIIRVAFSPGMSAADRAAAINDAVQKCAIARLFCGDNIPLQPVEPPPDAPHPPIPPPEIIFLSHQVDIVDSCPGGQPFHYVLPAGYFAAATQQEADILASRYALLNFHNFIFCLKVPAFCACAGTATDLSVVIVGGSHPFFAAATNGHLPDGMTVSVSGKTIHIAGTPSTPGSYSFDLNVYDSHGNYLVHHISFNVISIGYSNTVTTGFVVPAVSSTATSSITGSDYALNDVIQIARVVSGFNTIEFGTFQITALNTPSPGLIELTNLTGTPGDVVLLDDVASWDLDSPLPNIVVGTPYSFQLPATGGSGSYTWSQFGDLPDGLTLSGSGLISGTPTSGDSTSLTVIVSDDECPPAVATVYWGILDVSDFNPFTIFPSGSGLDTVTANLQSEVGPFRASGYHLLNPFNSDSAFGWFCVPESYMTPVDTTGFKWSAGNSASPIWNVMNTANYNIASPPFPPDATILNYFFGDHTSNGWVYYTALWNFLPYRFYLFSECIVPSGGNFLNGAIGSDTFTLYVNT
jgi:hypothetical protein